jgi:hypothetical protein
MRPSSDVVVISCPLGLTIGRVRRFGSAGTSAAATSWTAPVRTSTIFCHAARERRPGRIGHPEHGHLKPAVNSRLTRSSPAPPDSAQGISTPIGQSSMLAARRVRCFRTAPT